jgi:TldD protein
MAREMGLLETGVRVIEGLSLGPDDFVDVRFYESWTTTVLVRNGVVEQAARQHVQGAAARALLGGAWGFSSSPTWEPGDVGAAMERAVKLARAVASRPHERVRVSRDAVYEGRGELQVREDPRAVPLEEKIGVAVRMERAIRGVGEAVKAAQVSLSDTVQREVIVNSLGTRVETWACYVHCGALATASEAGLTQNAADSISGGRGWETIGEADVEAKGREVGERAARLLGAEKPPSGRMNIIMDPSLVGVFIHEAFGHASEADLILANRSVLSGRLGSRVGVEAITVIDDPTIPGLRGSYAYDSEGTRARRRVLVERGVLKEHIHSLETAGMMGVEPNGGARAMDHLSRPVIRMGNTIVLGGDMSLEELAEAVKDGIYLAKSYGGYVDTSRGQFYFSAQEGYLIRQGRIGPRVQNVSMSGLTLEVLENTVGAGRDVEVAFPGTCGKQGQWIPVAGGGPHLAVRGVVVGGR